MQHAIGFESMTLLCLNQEMIEKPRLVIAQDWLRTIGQSPIRDFCRAPVQGGPGPDRI